ncbi:MAG: hypothetical protein NC048_08095 [Bacteroides sp.]|nr:hypothetical protein [Ruminococcus flavefaciens]MCM1555440.1 hypothetical protein [Bacteroides sp.]
MKNSVKFAIQAGLIVVAIVLAVLIYRSIMQPVNFNRDVDMRKAVLVQQMKDIRKVQQEHKKAYGSYIATGDSLIAFLRDGQVPYVKMIGTVPDSLTEEEAVAKGIVSRETFTENAFAVLFPDHEADKEAFLRQLMRVPFNQSGKLIEMEAGFISKSGYQVPVFEAKVPYEDLLEGLNEQQITNKVAQEKTYNRYPGIKVGSMTEAITEGNWE